MTNSDVDAVAQRLHELGLDPFHPSDDAIEFSRRPEMPSPLLTEIDRIGVHQQLVLDEIHVRFWHQLTPWTDPVRLAVHASATVLALRSAGYLRGADFVPEYQRRGQTLYEWVNDRLKPVEQRLSDWLDTHDMASEEEYEPASTLIHLVAARRWVDLAEDTRLFKRGFVLAEEGGVTKAMRMKLREELAKTKFTGLDVLRMLHLFERLDPEPFLSDVGMDRRIRFEPHRVRDAFDRHFGVIEPVQEPWAVEIGDVNTLAMANGERAGADAIDAWHEHEDFRDFRRWLAAKQHGDPARDPFALLSLHLDDVAAGRLSTRALAEKHHVSRGRLTKAWREVEREIRRRIMS